MKNTIGAILHSFLTLGVVVLVTACGHPAIRASQPQIVATIPPGSKMHNTELDAMPWAIDGKIQRVQGATGTGASYVYIGTGKPNGMDIATLKVPVEPGTIYLFSAIVDPSKIAIGSFDLIIDTADGKSTYSIVGGATGPPSRFYTPPWRAPAGVTNVLLGMQLVGSTVAKGEKLSFSRPLLTDVILSKPAGN